jgi:hypothetical protein
LAPLARLDLKQTRFLFVQSGRAVAEPTLPGS